VIQQKFQSNLKKNKWVDPPATHKN
jgi:hypothetical protein